MLLMVVSIATSIKVGYYYTPDGGIHSYQYIKVGLLLYS